ncbi:hypothetical protein PIB30_081231 [Stylosanthes scabra]|uniref:Uncharacterized protein n=1 Tax=Stylosanthes scabra TaxID=79078 RepID=A0ABU6SSH7_9FABA|nr:hypothetical protein [Stylosanthes scabra]
MGSSHVEAQLAYAGSEVANPLLAPAKWHACRVAASQVSPAIGKMESKPPLSCHGRNGRNGFYALIRYQVRRENLETKVLNKRADPTNLINFYGPRVGRIRLNLNP